MLENSLTCTTPDLSDEELNPTPNQPFIANLTIKFNSNILVPMSYDGQIELPTWEILYYPDPILDQFEDHVYQLDLTTNTVLIRVSIFFLSTRTIGYMVFFIYVYILHVYSAGWWVDLSLVP